MPNDLKTLLEKYQLQDVNLREFTDGYYINFVCFWASAKPRSQQVSQGDRTNFLFRNHKDYVSYLTQIPAITKTLQKEQKMQNWNYLNGKVFHKLKIQLNNQQIDKIINNDQKILIGFFKLFFDNLQKYIDEWQFSEVHKNQPNIYINQQNKVNKIVSQLKADSQLLNSSTKNQTILSPKLYLKQMQNELYIDQLKHSCNKCPDCLVYQKRIQALESQLLDLQQLLSLSQVQQTLQQNNDQ